MAQGMHGMGMGMGMGGGGGLGRLHHALDVEDDSLGKVYDVKVVGRLGKYLTRVKSRLSMAIIGTIVSNLASVAMPYVVKLATDNYIKNRNINGLNIVAFAYVLLAGLTWAGQYVQNMQLAHAGQWVLLKLRADLLEHLNKLSMRFFDNNRVGTMMSRMQDDVDQLNTLLTQDMLTLIADILTLIAIATIMLIMNWQLGLLALAVAPLLVIIMIVWQKFARRAFMHVRRAMAMVNGQLQESLAGMRVTQGLSREDQNLKQFDRVNKSHLDANVEAARLQSFMVPVVDVLTNISFAIILVFGGAQLLAGKTTPGVLLAFLLYIQRFFSPVQELTIMYTEVERAMASGAHIFELMNVQPELTDNPQAIELPHIKGEVKFGNVSFSYEPDKEVLHNINLTIKPGETVAIAGRTGAGKSSLTNLIVRFYDVTKGEVLVDGYNVDSVTQQSLRRQIGVVPQDPILFSGTVEENIKYGRPEVSHEEVIAAAKAAGVHDFISRLENGYDTQVGEKGSNLSAGQRQLLCLARAILIDPPILIMDEATSNVDTNTERIMQAALRSVSQGRTTIIIAHRLSTVTHADRIIVLEEGNLVEVGSHQELLARQGLYYQMFQTLSAPGVSS